MNEKDIEKAAQTLILFGMFVVAIILAAIAVGLFFGAHWAFALLALCAIVLFIRARKMIRKKNKEDGEA